MESIKERYFMKALAPAILTILFIVLAVMSILYERTIFLTIALFIASAVALGFTYYGASHFFLLINKKTKVLYEGKIDLTKEYDEKEIKKNKTIKLLNKILFYALIATPFILLLCLSLGIFVLNSLFISIVIPSFIFVLLVILFFTKEFISSANSKESKDESEIVYLTEKVLFYKNYLYIINKLGFKIVDNKYKFTKLAIQDLNITEDYLLEKLEGLKNEVRN